MGIVFDIQKCSVHDGPGIRTTVFLKGCNIRCLWCHNPESFKISPQISVDCKTCTGCGRCITICPNKVHQIISGNHQLHPDACTGCNQCVSGCPTHSLKVFGQEMSTFDIIKEVEKDLKYYHSSGGGVTFSGGEPTLQPDFLYQLLKECKKREIHTCLETNGIIPLSYLKKIEPYVDLYLLDYKATGSDKHKELTGNNGQDVLQTIEYLNRHQRKIILRCPIIQGLNDSSKHFAAIRSLKRRYNNIIQVEIMPYHALGKHKWDSLGLDYQLKNLCDTPPSQKQQWESEIS